MRWPASSPFVHLLLTRYSDSLFVDSEAYTAASRRGRVVIELDSDDNEVSVTVLPPTVEPTAVTEQQAPIPQATVHATTAAATPVAASAPISAPAATSHRFCIVVELDDDDNTVSTMVLASLPAPATAGKS